VDATTGVPVVTVSQEPGVLIRSGLAPTPPLAALDLARGAARWVALVGRLGRGGDRLVVEEAELPIEHRCDDERMPRRTTVSVTAMLLEDPLRLIVPCGGIVAAPLLTRATGPGAGPGAAQEVPDPRGAVLASESTSPSGPVPAALLLIAATTLVGGALAARRLTHGGSSTPDAGAPATDMVEEPESEASSPPSLTLVPMPRERAP
jgi:hypothetical protein